MIKSLQKRFIVTAMVAISLLLAVLLGVINVVNHVTTQRQIDYILEALVDNLGSYDPPGLSDFQMPRGRMICWDPDILLSFLVTSERFCLQIQSTFTPCQKKMPRKLRKKSIQRQYLPDDTINLNTGFKICPEIKAVLPYFWTPRLSGATY